MIDIKGLSRGYDGRTILDNIDLKIEKGGFTVILGRNGSGKSTLVRHLNALLLPEIGTVTVDGLDTSDPSAVFDIRARVGMVFQNPDSQAVASIVEDDTAFAPENLGLDEDETQRRIDLALDAVGISHLRRRSISSLSGGQKQLVAIAGIVAMQPEYMVFDEATSMLDPAARRRVLDCVLKLKEKLTVIWITHYMEEAVSADRVIIMDNGRIKAAGAPRDIFGDPALIKASGLRLPICTELALRLERSGFEPRRLPLTAVELAAEIKRIVGGTQ